MREGRENVCLIFISYVPYLKGPGEIKTKLTQHGVKELMRLGLTPDIIIGRCEVALDDFSINKISMYTGVPESSVFFL